MTAVLAACASNASNVACGSVAGGIELSAEVGGIGMDGSGCGGVRALDAVNGFISDTEVK